MKHIIKRFLLSLISSVFVYFLVLFSFAYFIARETKNAKMLYPYNWEKGFIIPYYISGILSLITFIIQIQKPIKNE
jgi:hypothetical protein